MGGSSKPTRILCAYGFKTTIQSRTPAASQSSTAWDMIPECASRSGTRMNGLGRPGHTPQCVPPLPLWQCEAQSVPPMTHLPLRSEKYQGPTQGFRRLQPRGNQLQRRSRSRNPSVAECHCALARYRGRACRRVKRESFANQLACLPFAFSTFTRFMENS